uniref:Uncharacterized protein n=1 Tax=Timspurckia oligopyrenoides TaxID=708627 RepID=A0A7S0ZF66_9RHOD|mmetsp:Transcript_2990/g.5275  ORF Transcript_2990/g.5275 Transcript_2990/m.5275 type:complete len:349 (+) Transcript_2990:3-1049(+)
MIEHPQISAYVLSGTGLLCSFRSDGDEKSCCTGRRNLARQSSRSRLGSGLVRGRRLKYANCIVQSASDYEVLDGEVDVKELLAVDRAHDDIRARLNQILPDVSPGYSLVLDVSGFDALSIQVLADRGASNFALPDCRNLVDLAASLVEVGGYENIKWWYSGAPVTLVSRVPVLRAVLDVDGFHTVLKVSAAETLSEINKVAMKSGIQSVGVFLSGDLPLGQILELSRMIDNECERIHLVGLSAPPKSRPRASQFHTVYHALTESIGSLHVELPIDVQSSDVGSIRDVYGELLALISANDSGLIHFRVPVKPVVESILQEIEEGAGNNDLFDSFSEMDVSDDDSSDDSE